MRATVGTHGTHASRREKAFTLIELMVVVAVVAIIAMIAAPSFIDLILMQRLKGVSSQMTTDMQFARAEAASRNLPTRVKFGNNTSLSCYVIYIGSLNGCTCTSSPVCGAGATEIRTQQTPKELRVELKVLPRQATDFQFDPATGAMIIGVTDFRPADPNNFGIDALIDTSRTYRTIINPAGRPSVCKPSGSTMAVPSC